MLALLALEEEVQVPDGRERDLWNFLTLWKGQEAWPRGPGGRHGLGMSTSNWLEKHHESQWALLGSMLMETRLLAELFVLRPPSGPQASPPALTTLSSNKPALFLHIAIQSSWHVDFPPCYFLLLKLPVPRIHFKCHSATNISLSQRDVAIPAPKGSVRFVWQMLICIP